MTEAQAAGLGAELRAARQAQGWELPQLAASLRIRQTYLEAIEAGRVGDLPGPTYALGFVRTYATALGLPGEDMARRFRASTTLANGQTALRFPAPVPQRGVPAGALMLLGVVILAGAYGGWYWVTEHRATPVEVVPPIPDRMVTETQKPQPSPQVATLLPATAPPAAPVPAAPHEAAGAALPGAAAPGTTPAATSPPQGVTAGQAGAAPGTGGTVGAGGGLPSAAPGKAAAAGATSGAGLAAPGAAAGSPAPGAGPVASAPVGAAPVPAAGVAPAGNGGRMVIRTTADAWVTVKQKSGPPLLNKLMHAGESWPVPADKTGLTLTSGNAGGTQIDVDGAPIPASLGGSGAVRRDLPLDADMLKAGKLPPARVRARPAATAQE